MLKGYQKKYLKGLAHRLKPVVLIGQNGLTDSVVGSALNALEKHELIKVKFIEHKHKNQKKSIAESIGDQTQSEMVGIIGHTAIFYKPHPDPAKRSISLPRKSPLD
jgi:RNA-binding protein